MAAVVVADDPVVPWWLRIALFCLLGGVLVLLNRLPQLWPDAPAETQAQLTSLRDILKKMGSSGGHADDIVRQITDFLGKNKLGAGAALGGILVARYGIMRPLLAGAILVASTNLLFVWLAVSEPQLVSLAVVISADNLSGGFATSAFIAWLSSLTSSNYTATQYALFSSLMTLPAKFIGGFAGMVVDAAGYAIASAAWAGGRRPAEALGGSAGELAQKEHAILVAAGGRELLGDEVHAVFQRGDQRRLGRLPPPLACLDQGQRDRSIERYILQPGRPGQLGFGNLSRCVLACRPCGRPRAPSSIRTTGSLSWAPASERRAPCSSKARARPPPSRASRDSVAAISARRRSAVTAAPSNVANTSITAPAFCGVLPRVSTKRQ